MYFTIPAQQRLPLRAWKELGVQAGYAQAIDEFSIAPLTVGTH